MKFRKEDENAMETAQRSDGKPGVSAKATDDDDDGRAMNEEQDIPPLSSSSSKRLSTGSAGDEAEFTPPLPNGQKRLHPLLDEERIAKQAAEGVILVDGARSTTDVQSNDDNDSIERQGDERKEGAAAQEGDRIADEAKTLRIIESMATEPGYPSPSGGFVPPVTDQDWSLADAPVTRARRATSSSSSSKTPRDGDLQEDIARRKSSVGSGLGMTASSSSTASSSVAAPQPIRSADYNVLGRDGSRHRASSSISSTLSSIDGGDAHSQAISARSSPSTVAPNRRRSSASADILSNSEKRVSGLAGQQDDEGSDDLLLPPLKVRDYAFDETDPRHVGARDVGLPSPTKEQDNGMSGLGGGLGGGGARTGMSLGLGGLGAHHGGVHEWGTSTDEYDDDDDDEDGEMDAGEESDGVVLGSGHPSSSSLGQTGLPLGLYYAAYDFSAESEHELDVKVGQRIRLIGHVDGGWAIVVRVGQGQDDISADDEEADKGLVPEAYLQWLGH